MPDPAKKDEDPFVIRTADFTTPPRFPFESRKGVFHPYFYVPFLGWIPQTEFMILIVVVGIVAALVIPHLHKRKPAAEPEPAPIAAPPGKR